MYLEIAAKYHTQSCRFLVQTHRNDGLFSAPPPRDTPSLTGADVSAGRGADFAKEKLSPIRVDFVHRLGAKPLSTVLYAQLPFLFRTTRRGKPPKLIKACPWADRLLLRLRQDGFALLTFASPHAQLALRRYRFAANWHGSQLHYY